MSEKKVDRRIGAKFWEARSRHGRYPVFASPEMLLESCIDYFNWVEENPLQEEKVFHANGIVTKAQVNKMRAMTIGGLCIFLDIGKVTWFEYCKREDFTNVTARVTEIIRNQKFAGAAADLFNANIIARDLGLRDQTPVEVVVNNNTEIITDAALKERGIPIPEVDGDDVD